MGIRLEKKVDITSQHLRIGTDESLENMDWDKPKVRYYLLSVAYDRIEAGAKIKMFLNQISPVTPVPITIGKFAETGKTRAGLNYMIKVVDSPMALKEVDLTKIGINIIQDRRFCERKSGDIMRYLNTKYHFK